MKFAIVDEAYPTIFVNDHVSKINDFPPGNIRLFLS